MSQSKSPTQPQERFAEYLRSHNKRRTAERYAILERAMRMQGHFSVEELCGVLRDDEYRVATTTVYSTLELIVDCGMLVRHRFNDKATLYEKAGGVRGACHHHLICTECGKIKEARDPELTAMIESRRFQGFDTAYFSLNIYGVCSACRRKARRRKLANTN
ncbi:MAG: Fur family transcriptional regulator [Bacteroidales bacterium]|nr:Fur family transcriptional regulator [Bacteroidales bacterium]